MLPTLEQTHSIGWPYTVVRSVNLRDLSQNRGDVLVMLIA